MKIPAGARGIAGEDSEGEEPLSARHRTDRLSPQVLGITMELRANLRELHRALSAQSDHTGNWRLISPEGRLLDDEGMTIMEVLDSRSADQHVRESSQKFVVSCT